MFNFKQKNVHRIFITSLIFKGLSSILEIMGGILFLFTGSVTAILASLIRGELIEEPTDFIATHIQHILPYLSAHGQLFGAVYLLSHGIIKIFLVINLIRGKMWAYPTTIATLLIFILYQLYRLLYGFSFILIFLTFFDLLIVFLTWHEYKVVKKFAKS